MPLLNPILMTSLTTMSCAVRSNVSNARGNRSGGAMECRRAPSWSSISTPLATRWMWRAAKRQRTAGQLRPGVGGKPTSTAPPDTVTHEGDRQ